MSASSTRFHRHFRIQPEAAPGHIEAKWPDPDLGEDVLAHNERYFSRSWHDLEWDRLWSRTWNLAARVSDLRDTGDYVRFDLGRESFVITRSANDRLQAFYNVCPHRGTQLVAGTDGTVPNFTCPYHAWSWRLDGGLRHIPDRETFAPSLVCDEPRLVEVHCATWGGFIFINTDDDPPPLEEFLGVLPTHLDNYALDEMMIISDVSVEWPVNWKIALDAFMEGYHIQARHPEGLNYLDDYNCQRDMFPGGHGRLIFPMACVSPRLSEREQLNPELREMLLDEGLDPDSFEGRAEAVRGAIQTRRREWAKSIGLDYSRFTDSQLSDDWNYSIFPNVTFNIHCDNALMMRFRPHPTDPERCYYDVMVLAHKVPDPTHHLPSYMGLPRDIDLSREVPRPPRIALKHGDASLGPVLDQDAEVLPLVPAGVRSRAFAGMRLSDQEIRMRHFYREYDRYMSRGTDEPEVPYTEE